MVEASRVRKALSWARSPLETPRASGQLCWSLAARFLTLTRRRKCAADRALARSTVANAPSLRRPCAHQRACLAVLATPRRQNINVSAQARSDVFKGFLLAEDTRGGGRPESTAEQGWLWVRKRAVPPSSVHASQQCRQAPVRRSALARARFSSSVSHLWSPSQTPESSVVLDKAVCDQDVARACARWLYQQRVLPYRGYV